MATKGSIVTHPEWALIRLHLRLEPYDRDTNAKGDVRRRIEVVMPDTVEKRNWLRGIVTPCVACIAKDLATVHAPVRERAWGSWYWAVSCALDERVGCSRSRAATREYRTIQADLEHDPPPIPPIPQLSLF